MIGTVADSYLIYISNKKRLLLVHILHLFNCFPNIIQLIPNKK